MAWKFLFSRQAVASTSYKWAVPGSTPGWSNNDGGNGRRAGLRTQFSYESAGSSPAHCMSTWSKWIRQSFSKG